MTASTPTGAERDVPSPSTQSWLGHLGSLRRKGLLPSYMAWWEELGDAFRIRVGPQHLYLFAHPDHVHHVLVSSAKRYIKGAGYSRLGRLLGQGVVVTEGSTWRDSRTRMQPLFLRSSVERFTPQIGQCVTGMLRRWEEAAAEERPIDAHQQLLPLTMQVITRCLLGADLSQHAPELGPLVTEAMSFIADRTFSPLELPLFVPTPRHRRFRRAMKTLRRVLAEAIHAHQVGSTIGPLLSALLEADSSRKLHDQQVEAELLNIFFAGYETTALALTWALWLLALQPKFQEELAAEAVSILGDAAPSVQQVGDLHWARSTFQEAIRLYPPAWIVARQSVEQDSVDGFPVPRGAIVLSCPFITHRHPDFWESATTFDPQRFLNPREERRHPCAYFPFGAGPRTCLGENFATLEATIALAMIAARFHVELHGENAVQPVGMATLYPDVPIMLRLSVRRNS